MKLSLITINYNNRVGLKKTIESVVAQTFKDFEWIVIDGGSTDGSRELLEEYARHFAYWVSEPDKGIYNAMNKGIGHAQGEYFQFLNSGDWLCDETALERCFSHKFDADIVYGNLFFCQDERKRMYEYPEKLSFSFLHDYSLGHNATFIRRAVMLEDLYDENLKIVSDWKFFLIQALKNRMFEHIDETVSCFDEQGISSVNAAMVAAEREKVGEELFPQLAIEDIRKMEAMDAMLNDNLVKGVLEYGKKKRLYRKLLNGCLRFIKVIDK